MNNVISPISISHEVKKLFRSLDSHGKDLAGYAEIRWWTDWVQQVQNFYMGIEKINNIAKSLKENDNYKATSKKMISLLKCKRTFARLTV